MNTPTSGRGGASNLFRLEAYNKKYSDNSTGEILLTRPISSWIVVTVSLVIVATLLIYFCVGRYTQRETTTGILLPAGGVMRIYAPLSGVVSARYVKEGDVVQKGQKLFAVSDERSFSTQEVVSSRGRSRDQGVSAAVAASLQTRLTMLADEKEKTIGQLERTAVGLREKIGQIGGEQEILGRHIALYEKRLTLAKEQLERDARLAKEGFISQQSLQSRQDVVLDVETQLISAQRQAVVLSRQRADCSNELAQIPLKVSAQEAVFSQRRAELEQEQAESAGRLSSIVVAPADGTIAAIMADAGSPATQQPLAALLPSGSKLEANLFVPSKAVGFVRPGSTVKLRYQPYPYQKFGQYSGVVAEVSRAPLSKDMLPPGLPASASDQALYRIVVSLDSQSVKVYGKDQGLGVGTLLEADILLDSRRLIEWIFEPIISLYGNVAN